MIIHTESLMGHRRGAHVPKKLIRQRSMGEIARTLLYLFFTAALMSGGILPHLHLGPGRITIQTHMHYPSSQPFRTTTLSWQTPPAVEQAQNVLYSTVTAGASNGGKNCDEGSEVWQNANRPNVTCDAGSVSINNAQKSSAGTFLTSLPHNLTYPDDYIVEAQVQQDTTSHTDFGLFFRIQPGQQPGQQAGAYSFLIHPNGTWSSYVYDATTGAPTEIAKGGSVGDANGVIAMNVLALGPDYTFYINRSPDPIGHAHDTTYLQGTAGIAMNGKGKLTVQSFALYTQK